MTEDQAKQNKIRDERYAEALAEMRSQIATWDDFFKKIAKKVGAFQKCGCPAHAKDALYTMFAFFKAMEEMPEEGDVVKLMERALRIIFFESKDTLGDEIVFLTEEEEQRMLNTSSLASRLLGGNLMAALRGAVGGETIEAEATNPAPAKDKPRLH